MIQVRYPSDAVPMHIDDIDVEASVRLWHWIRTRVYLVDPGNVQICTVWVGIRTGVYREGPANVRICTIWVGVVGLDDRHWIPTGVYRVGPGNVRICTVWVGAKANMTHRPTWHHIGFLG